MTVHRPAPLRRALVVLAVLTSFGSATLAAAQAPPGRPTAPAGRPAAPPAGQQAPPPATPAPVTIEPEVADFGLVAPGSKHPATFRVRNNGRAPLNVTMVMPTCKCTATRDYTGTVVNPGDFFELEATLDAPSYPGVKEAKINILFAGHGRPSVVTLKCDVRLPIRAVEEFVDALEEPTGVLTIESPDGRPFTILSSNGEAPSFVDRDASSGPVDRYKVNWSVEGWPCDGMRLWWIIETDRDDCPVLPCRIRHQCTGGRADPQRVARKWIFKEPIVNAGRLKPGETVRLTVDLENSEPKAGPGRPATFSTAHREITGVSSQDPNAVAKFIAVQPRAGEDSVVTFDFTPSATYEGLLYAIVRVAGPTGVGEVAVVASVRR